MADQNQNLLGVQANVDDVLSHNDNNNIGNADSTIVDVETDDVLSNNDVNSHNDSSDNSINTDNSNNSDNSNNADNSVETEVEVEVEDSFNDNSNNSINTDNSNNSDNSVETEVEVEVDESFNGSFNDQSTNVDVDLADSFNDNSDNSVRNQDSFNITSSFNTQTLNDHSTTTTVGVRQYQANNGDFNLGGLFGSASAAGFGGGHGKPGGDYEANISIDNSSFVFDQSVNQVISTNGGDLGGNVIQGFSQTASIAFGDNSIAAGRDVNIDNSVVDFDFGDVNIGNTHVNTTITDSFNDFSHNFEVEFEDSFNDYSTHTNVQDSFQVNDSFTTEIDDSFNNSWEWENEGNIFSPGAATTGGDVDTTVVDLF